ncbi:MAG: hypothetical protein A4E19_18555 [Nitrospira sp. SG-bin1]|nr:MAG: hypothetical protein A4E19_18555 [Nitrospira sp. SG-bin1]
MLCRTVASTNCSRLVHVADRPQDGACHDPSKFLRCLLTVLLTLITFSAASAWGGAPTGGKQAIVAAGFGYQIGALSSITVKVYDAESGDILSNEVYELAVKESEGVSSNRGPRIFAGGVGLGATDLSNFILRVYDANTGVFQWEGRLNLVQTDWKAGGQAVSTGLPRRATVMKRLVAETPIEQPVFLLRAMDAATGMLVWQDEFTTVRAGIPRAHQIVDRATHPDSPSLLNPHTFNFRIRMYDPTGSKVLWEDQLFQADSDEGPEQSHRDQADMLPAWPNLPQGESAVGSI